MVHTGERTTPKGAVWPKRVVRGTRWEKLTLKNLKQTMLHVGSFVELKTQIHLAS